MKQTINRISELRNLAKDQQDAHVDTHSRRSLYWVGYLHGLRAVEASLEKEAGNVRK